MHNNQKLEKCMRNGRKVRRIKIFKAVICLFSLLETKLKATDRQKFGSKYRYFKLSVSEAGKNLYTEDQKLMKFGHQGSRLGTKTYIIVGMKPKIIGKICFLQFFLSFRYYVFEC